MQALLTTALELLLIAVAVGLAARRLRVHYNIALVVAGVAVSATQLLPRVALSPEIVLQVFLPVLLLEASISTDLRRLRENLVPVVVLALPGMLLAVLLGGLLLAVALRLPLVIGLVLGAILAATDTIAVIATIRSLGAPPRLSTIVENESLFNDGTALVAFTTLLGVVASGRFDPESGLLALAWVSGAGLVAGAAVGGLTALLLRRTDDPQLSILMTIAAAYGSAQLAEAVHASAILAIVAAGITARGSAWSFVSAPTRVAIRSFWEVAAFAVNAVVFLLVGLQVDAVALLRAAPAVAIGLAALTVGRMAGIYLPLALLRPTRHAVPTPWQHLLVWGNLKGSLSMALALSLPASLPHRELLVVVTFGCALVTLTAQGLTLGRVARRLGIGVRDAMEDELESHQGRLLAARAGQAELDRLQHMGLLALADFQRLRAQYQQVIARSERGLRDLSAVRDAGDSRRQRMLRRHLLLVEKSAVREAVGSGILADEVGGLLTRDIDDALDQLGNH